MNADFFMNILFPAECLSCGRRLGRGTLCTSCRAGITPERAVFCGTCGARLPGFRKICHPNVPYILGAAGNYRNETLRELIHALKFHGVKGAAKPLADILAHYSSGLAIDFRGFCVVPIPISRERARERGFNQSTLIAERFAHFFGIPLRKDMLSRVRHRPPQSDIADRDERWENIRDCFVAPPAASRGIASICGGGNCGKIILIDDVTTSGATFTEAARALRSAGARKILALAVAKAIQ